MFWFCFHVMIKNSQVGWPPASNYTNDFKHAYFHPSSLNFGCLNFFFFIESSFIFKRIPELFGKKKKVAIGIQIACFRYNMVWCEIETADWWETSVSNKYKLVCLVKSYTKQSLLTGISISWGHLGSLGQQPISESII